MLSALVGSAARRCTKPSSLRALVREACCVGVILPSSNIAAKSASEVVSLRLSSEAAVNTAAYFASLSALPNVPLRRIARALSSMPALVVAREGMSPLGPLGAFKYASTPSTSPLWAMPLMIPSWISLACSGEYSPLVTLASILVWCQSAIPVGRSGYCSPSPNSAPIDDCLAMMPASTAVLVCSCLCWSKRSLEAFSSAWVISASAVGCRAAMYLSLSPYVFARRPARFCRNPGRSCIESSPLRNAWLA